VGLGARTWQRGPGVSASPGEPPAAAVSGGSGGQQLTRTRATEARLARVGAGLAA